MNKFSNLKKRGVTAVEVLVGASIAGVILVMASYAISKFINASSALSEKTQAVYLAEDGIELLRYIRDNDWANIGNLTAGTTYYLAPTATGVHVSGTPESIGSFNRSFVVEQVRRDNSSDDIVPSGAGGSSVDTDTRFITVTIAWGNPAQSISLTSLLANQNP